MKSEKERRAVSGGTGKVARWGGRLAAAGVLLVFLALLLDFLFPPPLEDLHPPASRIVADRDGRPLRFFLSSDEKWRFLKTLDDISPAARDLVIRYEDRHFHRHFGVNPLSVLRAFGQNLRAGRVVSGGSTLTMQLARMLEPKPRTLLAKIVEAFRAVQIEVRCSKDEILEAYLNRAPYGGNIEGIGAAAWFYLGKEAAELSRGEAALLAALPNSPERLRPDRYPERAREARNKVLRILSDRLEIPREEARRATSEPVPAVRHDPPFKAPHFSRFVGQAYPARHRVDTTLDRSIQEIVENIVGSHVRRWRSRDVEQMAAVVLDNRTGDVLALVGSNDFFEEEMEGQVNGALAPRSPGSTLKPFVYALAFDRGLLTPDSLMEDLPVRYGVYAPENFDGEFRGAVTVRESLAQSLNVPAVAALSSLGREGLLPFLKSAGVTTLSRKESEYGLSLVLGGCELNLLELANLYATLARGGVWRPYRLDVAAPPGKERRVLSAAAAFLVTEILAEVERPDLPACWEFTVDMPKVAWKTGTSYGHRDAWSVGYDPRYTVGVWAGNFAGRGAPELVGSRVAAPALFDIFHALPGKGRDWFERPPGAGLREICASSGMPAGPDCPHKKTGGFIRNVSPETPCNLHRIFAIDRKTGFRLCSRCREGKDWEWKTFTLWPPGIATWMRKKGLSVEETPQHNPECPAVQSGDPPEIRSPHPDGEIVLVEGRPLEYQKIRLEAAVTGETDTVFWYVDGELFWSGDPAEELFYTPTPGRHEFACADDMGRVSRVTVTVR